MNPVILENALEKKCKNRAWLTWILFLTASPAIFNSAHLASYVFLEGNPSFYCSVPELVEANWTNEQIREISSPGLDKESCVQYAWNYTLLKNLEFDDALSYTSLREKPDLIHCQSYIYEEETAHQTIVSEWDLVCDNSPLRSTVQGTVAVGKFFGAVLFGLISDRFGRKKTFIFSSIIYMVAGPSSAFVSTYTMFVALRLMIGVAGAGVYDTGYTILLELTVKNYRAFTGNIYNLSFSLGIILLPLAAYLTYNWRQLQLALSAPMVLLVVHCWFLPESPRWLITSGKPEKAEDIIGPICQSGSNNPDQPVQRRSDPYSKNMFFMIQNYIQLFSTFQLSKRIVICYYLWFLGALYYYVIALSGLTFEVNQYVYMGLNGIIEIPGILLPLLFLSYFGRKSTGIAFWTISGIAMLLIMVVPKGWPMMCVTLFGRLAGVAANGVVMFLTLELFPTENRNTAMGSCLTVAQLGPMLAPYMVEIVGKWVWWLPTTICGFLAFFGAFLMMFLPETRNVPMLDTVHEMKLLKKEVLCRDIEQQS